MAESVPHQIVLALQSTLAGIVSDGGANYWLTPSKVVRVPGWQAWDPEWFDKQYQTLYFLRPGLRTPYVEDAGRRIQGQIDVWLLAGTQYAADTDNPIALANEEEGGLTLGDTLTDRLQRDIEKAVRVDITLGGIAINTELPDWNPMTPMLEGWALTEARIKVKFIYFFGTP